MSYILEALKKDQTQAQAGAGPLPPAQTSTLPVMIESRQQSIAWGLLLTIAIFLALLAGFWLGQQSQQGNNIALKEKPSTPVSAIQPNKGFNQVETHEAVKTSFVADNRTSFAADNKTNVLADNKTNAEVTKIAAEGYFEQPPEVSRTNKNNNRERTVQFVENGQDYQQEKQLIVSAAPLAKARQGISSDFKVKAQSGVSDDLLARFQSAFDETKSSNDNEDSITANLGQAQRNGSNSTILPLSLMPLWVQQELPDLQFELHIYASDGEGWIRVNGEDKYQGDRINQDLILWEILPQKVILNYRGESFSLPALSNWSDGSFINDSN